MTFYNEQPLTVASRPARRASWRRLRLMVIAAGLWPVLAFGSCTIQVGSGGQLGDINLAVPYHSQGDFLLCGPTSVLMWRRFDGLSYIAPQTLGSLMSCPWQTQGCYPSQIAAGVQVQTASGFDAMLDDYGGQGDPDVLLAAFASRQITSLANGVPVIALINGATHAVIVKGGSYSTAGDGLKQWDYVYVHDPLDGGANRYFVAGQWLAVNLFQIVSDTATIGWDGKLQEFGGSHVLGWTAWPPGPFNQQ